MLSIWSYRRLIILHYFPNIQDPLSDVIDPEMNIRSMCEDEFKLTSAAIAKNPKSCMM